MVNEIVAKVGAWILVGIALVFYPSILFAATLYSVYRLIVKKPQSKRIVGDVAVVTGAARGLGKCIAEELARNGCHIAIVDMKMEEAEATARSIGAIYNVKTKAYKVDVTNYDEVVALNEKVTNDLGVATILVNNAGLMLHKTHQQPDQLDIHNMINVNLTSHFYTNKVFLPNMKERKKGHIVAISSIAGLIPLMHNSVYSATKYGVRGLMNTLRIELKAFRGNNIHCTTVFPSFLKTNEDVVNILQKINLDSLYPLISGEEMAQRIVYGLLRNEEEITEPLFFKIVFRFYENLPASWKDWILTILSPDISG